MGNHADGSTACMDVQVVAMDPKMAINVSRKVRTSQVGQERKTHQCKTERPPSTAERKARRLVVGMANEPGVQTCSVCVWICWRACYAGIDSNNKNKENRELYL